MSCQPVVHDLWQSATRWVIGCAICSAAAIPCFADVTYTPKSGNSVPRITISGQIKQDDLKHFIAFSRMAREEGLYQVRLDSLGGDVETALAMGRIIRLDKAAIAVLRDGRCLSSCVFVLAGGAIRYVAGPVGIHRPFAPVDMRTTASAQKQNYERLEKEVKAYLQAMNVPAELYDHMIRIPPEKVKVLNRDELQRYGLSEDDPYEDAARVAGIAKSMGITAEELIRRQAKANTECSNMSTDESGRCYTRILKEGR
jgi:hypothetical protein